MRDEVITDRRILDYIRQVLAQGCTIKATDPSKPIILSDGNAIHGNLTITYDEKENTNDS